MTDYVAALKTIREEQKFLGNEAKEVGQAMHGVFSAVVKDGAIDKKSKELIALGIAIAVRCEGCILTHVAALLRFGATLEEIAETVEVAVLMGGGPSVTYGGKAIAAAKQFIAAGDNL